MAMTLAQMAVIAPTPLARGVMETMTIESPILDRLPFKQIAGNSFSYATEGVLPSVAFRSVNEAYTESTGTWSNASEKITILGGDADVDKFLIKTSGDAVADIKAEQTRMKTKSLTYVWQDRFFNGNATANPKEFDGLKARVSGAQVIAAGTNGANVYGTDGANASAFADLLDLLVAQVPGLSGTNGAIYANAAVIARLRAVGRKLGGVDVVNADIGGKRAITWQGIPILDPGQTAAGVDILPRTETQGTATNASSLYAVKFGADYTDGGVTGLANGTVDVRDLGEIAEKPVSRTRIEYYSGLAVFSSKAAARLTGVIAA